jgi:hypothetical protein
MLPNSRRDFIGFRVVLDVDARERGAEPREPLIHLRRP